MKDYHKINYSKTKTGAHIHIIIQQPNECAKQLQNTTLIVCLTLEITTYMGRNTSHYRSFEGFQGSNFCHKHYCPGEQI